MKAIKVIIVILVFAVVGFAVASIFVDNFTSSSIESSLKGIAVPQNSSVDASVSKTGKLNQTAVLQYYGAILVKSSMPLGNIRSYYNANKPADIAEINVINLADGKSVLGDTFPGDLRFSQHDAAPNGYYIVYSFGEGQMPFPMGDFRSYVG